MSEKTEKTEKKIRTHTTIVVDRTGSMMLIKGEAEKGVNEYVEKLQAFTGSVSLYQFDRDTEPFIMVAASPVVVGQAPPILEHVYTGKLGKPVPKYTLVPRGNTPLYDAVALAILETRKTIEALSKKPDKVAVVIMTDGGENSSREHTFESVSSLIKEAQDRDGWRIEFLAGDMKAAEFARASGLRANTTRAFDSRRQGETYTAYAASAAATVDWYEEDATQPAGDAKSE